MSLSTTLRSLFDKYKQPKITITTFEVTGYSIGCDRLTDPEAVSQKVEPYNTLRNCLEQIALFSFPGLVENCSFEEDIKKCLETYGGNDLVPKHTNNCRQHTRTYLLSPGNVSVTLNPTIGTIARHIGTDRQIDDCKIEIAAAVEMRVIGREPKYISRLFQHAGITSNYNYHTQTKSFDEVLCRESRAYQEEAHWDYPANLKLRAKKL